MTATAHQNVWANAFATSSAMVWRQLHRLRQQRGVTVGVGVGLLEYLPLQNDCEERGGHRRPDLAHDVQGGRGPGNIGMGEVEVGRRHDRHHAQPEPQAPYEQGAGQQELIVVEVTKAKGTVAAAMMRMPGGTTRRGPSRSVIAPDLRIMRAAPMPCGAMRRPACHGLCPRAIW